MSSRLTNPTNGHPCDTENIRTQTVRLQTQSSTASRRQQREVSWSPLPNQRMTSDLLDDAVARREIAVERVPPGETRPRLRAARRMGSHPAHRPAAGARDGGPCLRVAVVLPLLVDAAGAEALRFVGAIAGSVGKRSVVETRGETERSGGTASVGGDIENTVES